MMALPDTRISLLQRLHDGHDTAAWTEFCAIYERAIFRIALKYGLQDADAREVSQEVLLTVSRRIRHFDFEAQGRFRSWLSVMARNATIDLLRKNRRTTDGGDQLQNNLENLVAASDETTLFQLEEKREQFRWAARQVQASVSASTWEAFWLTAVVGLPKEEVAQKLQISVGAVYVARCRVLAKIKRLVQPFREWERSNLTPPGSEGGTR
ncbi:MAG: sigma-70 family RNA polymerase sigma factor [bacterium]|nr:sigma-70 family RNA polymerase sigma factor [bacterium]